MLCSKSHCVEGLRHPGPVQVVFRIWVRCRSWTPGSCPRAWWRWSQGSVVIGPRLMIRSGRAGDPGGEPPGPPSARWSVPACRGEREPRWAGGARRVVPARFTAFDAVVLGFRPSAAVSDGVPVLVGDSHAPGGLRVGRRVPGQVPGQVGVDRADAGELPGPVGQAQQGSGGYGEVDLCRRTRPGSRCRPGRRGRRAQASPAGPLHPPRPARPPRPGPSRRRRPARRRRHRRVPASAVLGGEAGVAVEQDVQVGAGPQLVHAARHPSRPGAAGPTS